MQRGTNVQCGLGAKRCNEVRSGSFVHFYGVRLRFVRVSCMLACALFAFASGRCSCVCRICMLVCVFRAYFACACLHLECLCSLHWYCVICAHDGSLFRVCELIPLVFLSFACVLLHVVSFVPRSQCLCTRRPCLFPIVRFVCACVATFCQRLQCLSTCLLELLTLG